MVYVGIDPGKNGGYAAIDTNNVDNSVDVAPWDDKGFAMFMCDLSRYTREKGDGMIAAVEKVGAMPGQGVTSMFNFGKSAGYIEGVLTALGIPYQLVMPKRWKQEFTLNGKDKAASIATCKRLFPDVKLRATDRCRKDSDGMAEALLIAEFARRKM